MRIDVTELLGGRISRLDFDYVDDTEKTPALGEMLPEGVSVKPDGVAVSGSVYDTGGYMTLEANVTVRYAAECDRCLDLTDFTLEFELDRVVSAAGSPEERDRIISEDEEEWDGVTDDLIYVTEGCVDLTCELAEAISLELPMRHLCSDDCRGLCPVCGVKLSDEHPGCEIKKEIDPRLAILQKLLDSSENM